jgi:hypothetical protein
MWSWRCLSCSPVTVVTQLNQVGLPKPQRKRLKANPNVKARWQQARARTHSTPWATNPQPEAPQGGASSAAAAPPPTTSHIALPRSTDLARSNNSSQQRLKDDCAFPNVGRLKSWTRQRVPFGTMKMLRRWRCSWAHVLMSGAAHRLRREATTTARCAAAATSRRCRSAAA